ncbi:hypothetical protein TSOC_005380 [Tetrabaena socialis]|uniref:Uncharacterized protein n=1 Tax=Tetrabaena socialis TaxID=47790 RepID=A0A2J8A6E2_9CHLO|nr:hypothetical protein TSOC_005380 [Tetrabaena socialis]|eukprot:PNH08096.1 hypothetical protein TSOC_005380 [Tetrabaena socialis]
MCESRHHQRARSQVVRSARWGPSGASEFVCLRRHVLLNAASGLCVKVFKADKVGVPCSTDQDEDADQPAGASAGDPTCNRGSDPAVGDDGSEIGHQPTSLATAAAAAGRPRDSTDVDVSVQVFGSGMPMDLPAVHGGRCISVNGCLRRSQSATTKEQTASAAWQRVAIGTASASTPNCMPQPTWPPHPNERICALLFVDTEQLLGCAQHEDAGASRPRSGPQPRVAVVASLPGHDAQAAMRCSYNRSTQALGPTAPALVRHRTQPLEGQQHQLWREVQQLRQLGRQPQQEQQEGGEQWRTSLAQVPEAPHPASSTAPIEIACGFGAAAAMLPQPADVDSSDAGPGAACGSDSEPSATAAPGARSYQRTASAVLAFKGAVVALKDALRKHMMPSIAGGRHSYPSGSTPAALARSSEDSAAPARGLGCLAGLRAISSTDVPAVSAAATARVADMVSVGSCTLELLPDPSPLHLQLHMEAGRGGAGLRGGPPVARRTLAPASHRLRRSSS